PARSPGPGRGSQCGEGGSAWRSAGWDRAWVSGFGGPGEARAGPDAAQRAFDGGLGGVAADVRAACDGDAVLVIDAPTPSGLDLDERIRQQRLFLHRTTLRSTDAQH